MEKEIKEKYGQDIKIGDIVNYQANVENYDGTWKVLGIENGQILLMFSNPVKEKFPLEGEEGFLNLEKNLDAECIEYGTKVTFTLDNGFVKYDCSNGQSLKTELNSFKHADGRELGDDISEITIINNSYMYRWTQGESISNDVDVSLHKPLSNGIKRIFPINSSKSIWLANTVNHANRNLNR